MGSHLWAGLAAAPLLLAACTGTATSTGDQAVKVTGNGSSCQLSKTTAPSGNLTFAVTNRGKEVTEFYVFAADGLRVIGEIENIAPGLTRNLVVRAKPGDYVTACKPGMKGEGIRAPFTVTDSGASAALDADRERLLATATEQYKSYVRDQAHQLLDATKAFAAAVAAPDDEAARNLYPRARTHWERIEPVAESFGDLDPRLDLREAFLEEGQAWTGWHRLEKDLWPPANGTRLSAAERSVLTDQLVADTEELVRRIDAVELDPTQLGNGAKELLDEIATGKVTGEEEIWSHTDLWDFQANIDGARIAFEVLQPALETRNAELSATLANRFSTVQSLLDRHRAGDGFVTYDTLSPTQVQELATAVEALGEPLSQLTAEVVG